MKVKFWSLKELLIFNIKYYRYVNNFSQEKLSELCGFSTRYMTDIERGLHCPTIDKIEKISNALKIDAYQLFQNPDRDKTIVDRMNSVRQYNQVK